MVTVTWVKSPCLPPRVRSQGLVAKHGLDAADGAPHALRNLARRMLEAGVARESAVELDREPRTIVTHDRKLRLERFEPVLGIEPCGRRELEAIERGRKPLEAPGREAELRLVSWAGDLSATRLAPPLAGIQNPWDPVRVGESRISLA